MANHQDQEEETLTTLSEEELTLCLHRALKRVLASVPRVSLDEINCYGGYLTAMTMHPTDSELVCYRNGALSREASAWIAYHLGCCPQCCGFTILLGTISAATDKDGAAV
jgi:hypothetical protein